MEAIMAIRNIREMGDEVLNKKCREVKELTPKDNKDKRIRFSFKK